MTLSKNQSTLVQLNTTKQQSKFMPKIVQLPPYEAQKIAAGQVVERPANVVKELVENSIDAGATTISITIEDGGKKFIRITDNGCGMDQQDAKLCFVKHATSKITSVDELPSLTSFGFRGEALASIAAVSKVTLLTKISGQTEGVKVLAQEGEFTITPAASRQGTDIIVEDLFYNVPARAKFLKKRETETRHIMFTVQAMAFAYPPIHLQLFVDGKQLLNCPAQETMLQRCAQVWDGTTAKHMISMEATRSDKGISLCGAISNHQWFRYDRSGIFFLVNNRWVSNLNLGRSLLKGYNNVIPQGRYPMAAISIIINPALIDVNSHPRKEEIIFAHPRTVEQLVHETVKIALEKHVSKHIKKNISLYQPQYQPSNDQQEAQSFSFTPASFSADTKNSLSFESYSMEARSGDSADMLLSFESSPAPATHLMQEKITPPTSIVAQNESHTIIGQFGKTYILIEQQEGLYLVDQHAAHERILYEQFAKRFSDIPTINLIFPQMITISSNDLETIEPHLSLFAEHGIAIELFSKNQLIIQTTPVHLKAAPLQELVEQAIGWIKELSSIDKEQFHNALHEKLRAQMACKAAVKAGDTLSIEQMHELIKDLHETPNRFSCPHGRPTGWMMTTHDIEKKFRRKT